MIVKKRHKKKHTDYFFDSFKHLKNNLSNLIGIELPTLSYLGVKQYLSMIRVNRKSKYPDMRKIGLIDYGKPTNNHCEITEEAREIYQNHLKDFPKYGVDDLSITSRKNIASITPEGLEQIILSLKKFNIDQYKETLLRIILSYFDSADCIRPYLALLIYASELDITYLDNDTMLNILAQKKENILLAKNDVEAYQRLDLQTQEELKRPLSYIKNFLRTCYVIDIDNRIILDKDLFRRIQLEMDRVVFSQTEKKSRSTKEQSLFRKDILEAYQFKCAITQRAIAINDRYLLEAAHIVPYRDGGSFSVTNGIALSYEMHKMFDSGLFGFWYDDCGKLRIKVSSSKKITDPQKILMQLDNQEVFIPNKEELRPDFVAVKINLEKYLLCD